MKRKMIQLIIASWAGLACCFGATACGKGARTQPADSEKRAEMLQARIIEAGEDPAFPDRGIHPEVPRPIEEVLAVGNEIEFKNTIVLRDRQLFLVWHEDVFESPIREAHFEHRIQDPLNRQSGEVDRVVASFDPATRRWFIPLAKIFRGRAEEVDGSEQHWVTLDLLLGDGSRVELRLRFRASGPLPKIVAAETGKVALDQPTAMIESARNGMLLRRETIGNPTRRPLKLWIRKTSDESLTLISNLSVPRYFARNHEPPGGPNWDQFHSRGPLRVARLRAMRENEQSVDLDPGVWFSIGLGPYEKIVLEWFAFHDPSASRCQVPPPEEKVFSWTVHLREHCAGTRGEIVCRERSDPVKEARVIEAWSLTGARLSGTWGREIRVTETFVSAGEATAGELNSGTVHSAPEVMVLGDQFTMDQLSGQNPSGTAFPCQGVF